MTKCYKCNIEGAHYISRRDSEMYCYSCIIKELEIHKNKKRNKHDK